MSFWHAWFDHPTSWRPKPTPDYRVLLKKYMDHVMECEGVSFLSYLTGCEGNERQISPSEYVLLKEIQDEINT